MAGLADLERRIAALEDVEAIKKLKFRYWCSLDSKQWDELAECFAEDYVLDVPSVMKLQGRQNLIQFLSGWFGKDSVTTAHQGHQAEIEITSETTARGTWALRDHLLDSQANTAFRGRGYYEDEYIKEKGRWRIKSTKLTYIFTEGQKRGYGQDLAMWPQPQK